MALSSFGYEEKSETGIPWRDAFPAEFLENEAGICLKVTRERKKLSQTALAHMTGIPQPHISGMESGRRPIGKKSASLLGEALGVNYRVFL
ncbi:MAG: helix-turn-helix transcriptional regulator [Deltaproteobacteria bacterium]|nr:helix-turn-helix transcriptional regulator [Deltaproteobacteria bacterium]